MNDDKQNPMRPGYFMNYAEDESDAAMVLRKLACWLGVGGYNAPAVDARLFHEKIVDGVNTAVSNALEAKGAEIAALKSRVGWTKEMGFILEGANADEIAAYDCGCTETIAAFTKILDGRDTGAGTSNEPWESVRRTALALRADAEPINMVLYCPEPYCGVQHVDAPEDCEDEGCPHYGSAHSHPDTWVNPPHKSHLCHRCGTIWRPADVPTNGVKAIKTAGKSDRLRPQCIECLEPGKTPCRPGHCAAQPAETLTEIDGCSEENCRRCRTAPNLRGNMAHAGIGSYPSAKGTT